MSPNVESQHRRAIYLLVVLALAFGLVGGVLIATGLDWIPHLSATSQPQSGQVEPSEFLVRTQESFRDLVAAVRPAVVSIEAEGVQAETGFTFPEDWNWDPFEEFFNWPSPFGDPFRNRDNGGDNEQRRPRQQTLASGSGFIVDPDGYILTNNHVVQDASEVKVKLDDGRTFSAEIIGTDPETDVAVLKIEAPTALPYLEMGDSDQLEVGDWVMAIGNPFGNLAGTVTVGIVSARNREGLQLPGNTVYQDFIQTDAAINLGNSGGPLVDIYGRAVGINTAITAQGSGIGFAIPMNLAKFVYDSLLQNGEVIRGWIGVTIQNVDEDLADNLGLGDRRGALIADVVPNDPADRAGLRVGDVILEVAGRRVTSSQSASRTIAALPVGEPAEFKIWRDGQEMTVTVTPAQRENAGGRRPASKPRNSENGNESNRKQYLGLSVNELTSRYRSMYDIPSDITGVIITDVDPDSPAYEKGLREGMVITSINHEDITSEDDYDRVMAEAESAWQSSRRTVLMRVSVPDSSGRWLTQFLAIPFE